MLQIGRRHFIRVAIGLGVSLPYPVLQAAERGLIDKPLPLARFRKVAFALGTKVTISVLHTSERQAADALDAAFAAIEEVESHLSIYRPESQLSRLNEAGSLANPHSDLLAVLACARETSQRSRGAFDITVQPLWEQFELAKRQGRLPTESEIAAAKRCVDYRRVEVRPDAIRLMGHGTKITLNGIAQGYAADRALLALREHGIEHALIDTGELAALGDKSDDSGWQVGIQHPRQPDAFVALAKLKDRCLSTSGDYATSFSSDRRFHHIFDPASGASPSELASVSVAAPTAMQADAWSTASFVLGSKQAAALLSKLPDHDALFVLKDGSVFATPGFPSVDQGAAS